MNERHELLRPRRHRRVVAAGLVATAALLALGPFATAGPESRVEVVKLPRSRIQPQAVTDARGTIHLIYYQGDEGAGDLFYQRREAGEATWSKPLRVNSQPGSAVAAG